MLRRGSTFSFLSFLTAFLFGFLRFVPMQHAVAVRTQGYALLDFFHSRRKTPIGYEFVDALFLGASDDVVEINKRWVLKAAVGAFLRSFKLVPCFFVSRFIYTGAFYMSIFIFFVIFFLVLSLLDTAKFGVFVWH